MPGLLAWGRSLILGLYQAGLSKARFERRHCGRISLRADFLALGVRGGVEQALGGLS